MAVLYNKFCGQKACPEYIEWGYDPMGDGSYYHCVSCKKLGQSHDIDQYPEDCLFLDEIKEFENLNTNS